MCGDIAERLDRYLDGELPAGLQAKVELHLASCERCGAVLATIESLQQSIDAQLPDLRPITDRIRPAVRPLRSLTAAEQEPEACWQIVPPCHHPRGTAGTR